MPIATKLSNSGVLLGVNVIVCVAQGDIPPCGTDIRDDNCVWAPKLTCHWSVVAPVPPSSCPAAW